MFNFLKTLFVNPVKNIGKAIKKAGNSIGSFINDVSGTTATQEFNSAEAQKQRDWETQMSNTAHQRQVEDMRSAGLNPILSGTGGSGASTPTGSSASSNLNGYGALTGAAAVINSAASAIRAGKQGYDSRDAIGNAAKVIGTVAKMLS